ncbi:hypothetical protein B5S28_g68 [[Candida] boidinii]|nr:hypothetical protein B5S28_g68 [[Candida] boidinii]
MNRTLSELKMDTEAGVASHSDSENENEIVEEDGNEYTKFGNTSNGGLSLSNHIDLDDDSTVTLKQKSTMKPINWSVKKKLYYTAIYGLITFAAQLNSTTTTAEFPNEMKYSYGIGREVSLLSTTLYILGIAFGPMVFAPLSEVYGRKIGVMVPFFISALFTFATAISYNVPAIMICRFISGFFSGAPIVSSGGVLSDIWLPTERGKALAFYAVFVSSGATFGPVISSLIVESETNIGNRWRIPLYFSGLLDLFLLGISLLTIDETYEPVIASKIAKKIRIYTQNWSIHSKLETKQLSKDEIISVHLVRPFAMLATPIIFIIALFASYSFGIFYIFVTTCSEAFYITRGWENTIATLPNVALFLGVVIGCGTNMLGANGYGEKVKLNGGKALPEERFQMMMRLGWLMPAGIFVFAWTQYSHIHWIVPCIGILMLGCGFVTVFQGCLNYLVDGFTGYSASAIAANTFLRSLFAAAFPLFAKQLMVNLGVHWGSSLIGFVALGMIPIPFVFYRYGKQIRSQNPFGQKGVV